MSDQFKTEQKDLKVQFKEEKQKMPSKSELIKFFQRKNLAVGKNFNDLKFFKFKR